MKFAASNTPGGNIWYLRLAAERLLIDNAMRLADPDAEKAFRRQLRKRARDYGQGYWWAPGQSAPFAQTSR